MTIEQMETVQECAKLSAEGSINFGEVVRRLKGVGIERYHADYSRGETTFYSSEGGSCIVEMKNERVSIANDFMALGVEKAVRQAQRGEINYTQFTQQAVAAGCVGYFVQITGQCVQYFGHKGEIHTEWFPGAHPANA